MTEPECILPVGTAVVTHSELDDAPGLLVGPAYVLRRAGNERGVVKGVVGGHGGDVYWVEHGDGAVACYGWWEFELIDDEK